MYKKAPMDGAFLQVRQVSHAVFPEKTAADNVGEGNSLFTTKEQRDIRRLPKPFWIRLCGRSSAMLHRLPMYDQELPPGATCLILQ